MLLSGRCELVEPAAAGSADFILRGEQGLFCVVGRPRLERLAPALARSPATAVLCPSEEATRVGDAIPGWTPMRAVLHTLGDREILPGTRPTLRSARTEMLSPRDTSALDQLPGPLRAEISAALGATHVAAAFADERPVSFCYAAYETESLWDLSVETLPAHRGKGLGRACCELLIAHMSRHAKGPVWGALEENVVSVRMAERLGFVAVDAVAVFEPPGAS